MIKGYIGTYNTFDSKGVYQFGIDETTGRISRIQSFYAADDAKCVALAGNKLIITMSKENKGGIALLDKMTGELLDTALYENKTPCFIGYDSGFVYTANYHDGTVMIYQIKNDKLHLTKRIDIQTKAGCHQVILHDDYLLIPCLLMDEIRIFKRSEDFALVKILKFPQGTGPRHGVFNKKHTRFYLVSELSNEFFAYDVEDLHFKLIAKIALVSQTGQSKASSAAIRLTRDETCVYISTRGADLLSVICVKDEIKLIQQRNSGKHPRDFVLSNDERYLLTVNRDSDNLIIYKLDRDTKIIGNVVSETAVPHGVGIVLENEVL